LWKMIVNTKKAYAMPIRPRSMRYLMPSIDTNSVLIDKKEPTSSAVEVSTLRTLGSHVHTWRAKGYGCAGM
jgi:hypothetical protein